MYRTAFLGCLIAIAVHHPHGTSVCHAGMPTILPTEWTADSVPFSTNPSHTGEVALAARFQALSFFIACVLLSAWGVKLAWNSLRTESTRLPSIGYWRSLGLVVLWGLCFVIVLTMVSGARELMTPGAWKQEGWTYKLADSNAPASSVAPDGAKNRRHALEQLRFALWQFAAKHDGAFPPEADQSIDRKIWEIPGWSGLRFVYVAGRSVDDTGRLLAFEPELDSDERQVLLTNGFVGTMRTPEIESALAATETP